MRTFFQDLFYGARMLRKTPGFTLMAIFALGLGIGANSAVYSLVDAILLRPITFPELDRVVEISETLARQDGSRRRAAPANFVDWKTQQTVFEEMAAYRWANANLTGSGEPERLWGFEVTANFFSLLKAQPLLGRTFAPGEDQPGRNQGAVLTHELWQQRFAADSDIIGKTISLNGRTHTVIGVMAEDNDYPRPTQLWVPLAMTAEEWNERGQQRLNVLARLKPGVTLSRAKSEMEVLSARLADQYPLTNAGSRAQVALLRDSVSGDYAPMFMRMLMAAVGFVLLIACVNIANMQLARASSRDREIALRSALGASRWRIIRQLLTESVLLSLLGAIAGLLLAYWFVDLIRGSLPAEQMRYVTGWKNLSVNPQVITFTLITALICSLLFGLVPALQVSRPDLTEALKDGGRGTSGSGKQRLRRLLIISEIALALVLMVGAGLTVKGFMKLAENQKQGFTPGNLLTMRVTLPESKYREDHQITGFYQQALERLRSLPEVRAAAVAASLPASQDWASRDFLIEGKPAPLPGQSQFANFQTVSPAYFQTMRIPLTAGREFSEQDGPDAPRVAVISEAMAKLYWPGEDPIGKRVRLKSVGSEGEWFSIVGIAGNVRRFLFDRDFKPTLYLPQTQLADPGLYFVLRTPDDPMKLLAAARARIADVDPALPVYEIKTMDQSIAESLSGLQLMVFMMGLFGAMALLLAAIGVYGVMAYSVSRRTQEIGIRLALGAQSADIFRMVTGQGLKLTAIGMAIGFPAAYGLSRLMASALFGVVNVDYLAISGFTLLLALVALFASYLPARRATQVDPIIALRNE